LRVKECYKPAIDKRVQAMNYILSQDNISWVESIPDGSHPAYFFNNLGNYNEFRNSKKDLREVHNRVDGVNAY